MSIVSGVVLASLSVSLIVSTVLLSKAIIDNLKAGDVENNVSM